MNLIDQLIHTNRIATVTTRPMFSISVLNFHLRLEADDRGWGDEGQPF